MNREIKSTKETPEKLSETVHRLVQEAGGWINVMSRMTSTFDQAITSMGRNVDCPFPERHGSSQGKRKFRFTAKVEHEGRAICTCMQDRGMSPVELLMLDGIGDGSWVGCMRAVYLALSNGRHVRKAPRKLPLAAPKVEMSEEALMIRKRKLALIARDLLPLHHPDAHPARRYFANRFICWNRNMEDVKFHPGLQYWEENEEGKFEMVGTFPAIVSAFRDVSGNVVNLHRIFITLEGHKAPVCTPKKACSGLPNFKASSIRVASGVKSDRTLHVTEGVEKGWAIHLATGGDVEVAYSCSTLPALPISKGEYDHVVIWSDNDPDNLKRERKTGDGQFFAWRLARRLQKQGLSVTFMMPTVDHQSVKGRDWEDIVVNEGVLFIPNAQDRLQYLRTQAVQGGVFTQLEKVA